MAHRNGHWKRHATAPCIHILPKEPELLAILKVYVWTFMIVNSAYKTPFFRSSGSEKGAPPRQVRAEASDNHEGTSL